MKLLTMLLDKAVQHHCRKGFRVACDCEYCKVKFDAFYDLATAGKQFKHHPERYYFVQHPIPVGVGFNKAFDHETYRNDFSYALWLHRKRLRKEWRAKLAELKENA